MTEPARVASGEVLPDWQLAADEAIATCGGDPRATVVALLVMNDALERELDLSRAVISRGFSRGWHHWKDRDVKAQG